MPVEKTCFFIAPIGDEGSEIRKRCDQILKYVVEPPANECGYQGCPRRPNRKARHYYIAGNPTRA